MVGNTAAAMWYGLVGRLIDCFLAGGVRRLIVLVASRERVMPTLRAHESVISHVYWAKLALLPWAMLAYLSVVC